MIKPSILDLAAEKRQMEMMQDEKNFKDIYPDIPCRVCGALVPRRIKRDTCTKHRGAPASIAALVLE